MQAPLVVPIVLALVLAAQQPYSPARYVSGGRPSLPALAVGGGQVFVELTISPSGAVTSVTPLRATAPFTEAVVSAVSGWQFAGAMADRAGVDGRAEGPRPVASKVLVAAHFRPPAFNTPTLGEMPKEVAQASPEIAYPVAFREPPYPPLANLGGVALIQVLVDEAGKVREATALGSAPPFDAPALEAARQWSFRPARVNGRPTATYVYLVFGFAEPITVRP